MKEVNDYFWVDSPPVEEEWWMVALEHWLEEEESAKWV